jgi:hypothetical protein
MERACNHNCVRALLVSIALFNCCAVASMMGQRTRAPKMRAAAEPFATFHSLDRQLSVLGQQSAALQKTVRSPQAENVKTTRPWRRTAARMSQTVTAIENLALRMQRRYRGKRFGTRLFRRLRARATSVQSALKAVESADHPIRAGAATSEVDKRIVALGLEYNAITGGYAALHCAPGEWSCCEPKRQSEAEPANACRWICTKHAQGCRGFVGARTARQR